jgi:hypothetical protein
MQIHLASSHCGHKKEDSELFVRSESHILLMYKTPTVLNVEYLFFMWSYYVFGWDLSIWSQTHHGGFGTRRGVVMHFHVSQRCWQRPVKLFGVACQMEVSASPWLRAHPTQLRVTRHRVGCNDTQKRWVRPRDLYFWGLGCKQLVSHLALAPATPPRQYRLTGRGFGACLHTE